MVAGLYGQAQHAIQIPCRPHPRHCKNWLHGLVVSLSSPTAHFHMQLAAAAACCCRFCVQCTGPGHPWSSWLAGFWSWHHSVGGASVPGSCWGAVHRFCTVLAVALRPLQLTVVWAYQTAPDYGLLSETRSSCATVLCSSTPPRLNCCCSTCWLDGPLARCSW
jgi:hypothetical protein